MASFKTAKQIGDLMGLSVKALRLYETHGLISPGRTPAGWRSYSDTEIKQLYKIKALKSMGFKLADIAGLLAGDIEVTEILAVQAETLAEQSDGIKRSLTIVRHAHARVQDGEMLSTDDLIHLTQEINKMSEFEWTEAHEKLAKRTYSGEQIEAIVSHKMSPEFQAEVEQVWNVLIADADRLGKGPADSPEAKIFAQRWIDANKLFTQGDAELNAATTNWYAEGFSDPETAGDMPFSKEVWEFAQKAVAALQADKD